MSLSFKPVLMEKVLSGEKTVTRRDWPTNYKEGQVVSIVPGMGRIACGKVRIVSVTESNLQIDEAEAKREGFASPMLFWTYWLMVNKRKSLRHDERVARIEFELVEVTRTICDCCDGIGTLAATSNPPTEGKDA